MREAADWLEQNPRHHLEGVGVHGDDQGEVLILRLQPMDAPKGPA